MGMWTSLTKLWTRRQKLPLVQTNMMGQTSLRSMIEAALSGRTAPSYQRYQQVYKSNELVNAAINESVRPILTIPFIAEELDAKTEHWVRRELHPLSQLLADPNPTYDRMRLTERFLIDTFCLGNGLLLKRRKAGEVKQLWPLDAGRILVMPGDPIEGYYYFTNGMTFGTGASMASFPTSMLKLAESRYAPEDVIHLSLAPDPDYPIWGLPPATPALTSIDIDEAITAFLVQFFRQGTVMSVLYQSKMPLTKEDTDRIIKEWNQHITGVDRAFGFAVIDGTEGTITKLGTDVTKELGIHELRMDTEARILAPFNVPPVIVGAVIGLQSTQSFASYEQARAALYEENADVTIKRIETLFTKSLAGEFGPNLRVRADTTNVMALETWRKVRADRLNSEVAASRTTLNESRAEAGRPDIEGGDVLLQPLNLTPVPVTLKASSSDTSVPINKTRIRLMVKALAGTWEDCWEVIDNQIAASLKHLAAQDGGDDFAFDPIQTAIRDHIKQLPLRLQGATKHQDAIRLLLAAHILTARARKEP